MTTEPSLQIPGWTRTAAATLTAVVVAVVSTQVYFETRFVNKREHEEHEASDRREVLRIDKTLNEHMDTTRTEALRLGVLEAQLAAIREDVRWLREHAERRKVAIP